MLVGVEISEGYKGGLGYMNGNTDVYLKPGVRGGLGGGGDGSRGT